MICFFFFQAEDGIRDLVRSRGLGDVYKRQLEVLPVLLVGGGADAAQAAGLQRGLEQVGGIHGACLLYTSDAADDLLCVDHGGPRILKKKKKTTKNSRYYNVLHLSHPTSFSTSVAS